MKSMRGAGLLLWAGLLTGCAHKAPPPPPAPPPEPPPVTPDKVSAVRQQLQQSDPLAQVGQIRAVMADHRLVAVGDIPVADVAPGSAILLADGDQRVVAQGTVLKTEGQYLVVSYDNATREPRVNDLAIRMSSVAPPPGAKIQPAAGSSQGAANASSGNTSPTTMPADAGATSTTAPSDTGAAATTAPSDTGTTPSPATQPTDNTAAPTTAPSDATPGNPPATEPAKEGAPAPATEPAKDASTPPADNAAKPADSAAKPEEQNK